MWHELINSHNYVWNPYPLPMFVTGGLIFITGFFIWLNKRDLFGFMYFVWGISAVFWLVFGGLQMMLTKKELVSFMYNKITFMGVAFISINGYFVSLLWNREYLKKQKKILIGGYGVMASFALSNFFYSTMADGSYEYYWGKFPKFTSLAPIFLLCWGGFFVATTLNYYRAYRVSSGFKKRQLFILLMALVVVYIGAVDFVPMFGVEIYPFGYIPMGIFFFLTFFAIIRYRAFEIDTVIHKTFLWLATSCWMVIPAYGVFTIVRPVFDVLNTFWLTVAALGMFYLFLWYQRLFQPKIDHLFRRRKYDYQIVLGKVAEKIATTIDIRQLAVRLLREIGETMYLKSSLFYIQSPDKEKYVLIGKWGKSNPDKRGGYDVLVYTEEERNRLPEEEREISVEHPLCAWAIEQQDIAEKEQIGVDPRCAHIQEYALEWFNKRNIEVVVPIVLEGEMNALLGLGKKENLQKYVKKDIELLKKLGHEVGVTVFNALHYKDLLEKERLAEEVKLGQEIQKKLLPQEAPVVKGLQVAGLMIPSKEIGGDYYDYVAVSQLSSEPVNQLAGKLGIVIGDVSGKGVSAGLVMAMAKTAVHSISGGAKSPKEILVKTNRILHQHINGEKFMTMLYLEWDSLTGKMRYSSAGHEHILIYRKQMTDKNGEAFSINYKLSTINATVEVIPGGGFMLGMMPEIEDLLEDKELILRTGDKVILYTDGVTEARGDHNDMYSLIRLQKMVETQGDYPVDELIALVKNDVKNFIGDHEQYDDITLVAMEVL